jgi:hypothetical protein
MAHSAMRQPDEGLGLGGQMRPAPQKKLGAARDVAGSSAFVNFLIMLKAGELTALHTEVITNA